MPNSHSFENSYDQGTITLDLIAVSMGRTLSMATDLLEDNYV